MRSDCGLPYYYRIAVLRAAPISMHPRSDGMYRQGWQVHPGYMWHLCSLPLPGPAWPERVRVMRAQRPGNPASPAPAPEPEPERHGHPKRTPLAFDAHSQHGSSNHPPISRPTAKGVVRPGALGIIIICLSGHGQDPRPPSSSPSHQQPQHGINKAILHKRVSLPVTVK